MKRREFLALMGGALATRRTTSYPGAQTVVTTQPYLQNVRSDRATIMWATQYSGAGSVQYTTDGLNYMTAIAQSRDFTPSETALPATFTQYTVHLTQLSPNTNYSYSCLVDGSTIGGSQFVTAGPGPFNFLVLGDSGAGTLATDGDGLAQTRIAGLLAAEQAALLLHVGDIAYFSGTFSDFQKNHFNYYSGTMSRIPFFTAPGNHEYTTPGALPYFALHSCPTETVAPVDQGRYYSFDWGNVHFVSLDSNSFSYPPGPPTALVGTLGRAMQGTSDMLNWLARDLKSTRQFWKVVFFHQAPYAGGANYGDYNEADVRSTILPILEANGVQLVLNGHEHSYQRTLDVTGGLIVPNGTGTVYVTSGGGGYDLYTSMFKLSVTAFQSLSHQYMRFQVNGTQMTLNAINDRGALIEKVVISPQPVLVNVTFDPQPAAGALIKIHGANLATQESFASLGNAPVLSGTSLTIAGQSIPLVYVSPTQVVGQLPFPVSRNFQFTISTANGNLSSSATA